MTDIVIIGGGPAGLSAAVNGKARGKTVRLLSGGANYLSKAERVDNYLGFYNVTGEQMMQSFLEHAAQQDIHAEQGKAANIIPFGDYFMVNFDGEIIEAKTVVVATGVSKAKEIKGEKEFLGKGVSYCATCDGMLYRGKKVIVWGLSEESAKEANFLNEIGVEVIFVSTAKRAQGLQNNITCLDGSVTEVAKDGDWLSITVNEKKINAHAIFILRDSIAPEALIEGLVTENGYIQVNRRMETNIPGLFAAGDCTGKPLQVSKAVGEGLVAAQQAAAYLDK